ncbi:hypothetical protein Dsin_014280 [Dipteronia sinensis]|uniref:Thaumatin-like protein n=1 Tax=Dipteronia sinensis TaxID=43782 RepID=A0AAE0AMA7_9ROSI|nr:hypothetical protein Dsin_014280 [Dipteronia sinensis]
MLGPLGQLVQSRICHTITEPRGVIGEHDVERPKLPDDMLYSPELRPERRDRKAGLALRADSVEKGGDQRKSIDEHFLLLLSRFDGFNVPLEFRGTSSDCTRVIKCVADINGLCPTELRHSGGCYHPCTVFKNEQFCCNSGNCGLTAYSKSLKDLCPDVYTYPKDDATSMFSCPNGTDYEVVFCPN